ncbi:MAG: hypothetical protein QM793_09145 [Muricomes sp.]
MQKRKTRWMLSWLMVFALSLNVLMPSIPVRAQEETPTTQEVQQPAETANDDVADAATENTQQPADVAGGNNVVPGDTQQPLGVVEDNGVVPEGTQQQSVTGTTEGITSGTFGGPSLLAARAPKNVNSLITDLQIQAKASKGGAELTEIVAGQPFWIEGSFKVPTSGTGAGEDNYVITGDWAEYGLNKNIKNVTGNPSFDVWYAGNRYDNF